MAQLANKGSKKHILTIVIEDYYQVASFEHLIPKEYWGRFESRLQQNINACLALLESSHNKATFFVCGWIADNYPQILREIIQSGHEIGCQGYFHHHLDSLPKEKVIEDIRRSKAAVEKAIGMQVQGFRIAQGGLGEEHLWLLDELIELGFLYDSSLCRIGFEFSSQAFRGEVHERQNSVGQIYEVPVSSASLLKCAMPIAGGNYWRQLTS